MRWNFVLKLFVWFAKNQLGSPLFPQGFKIRLIVAWPPQEQRASALSVVLWGISSAGRESVLYCLLFSSPHLPHGLQVCWVYPLFGLCQGVWFPGSLELVFCVIFLASFYISCPISWWVSKNWEEGEIPNIGPVCLSFFASAKWKCFLQKHCMWLFVVL